LALVPVAARTARCTVWHTIAGRGAELRGTVVDLATPAAYRPLARYLEDAAEETSKARTSTSSGNSGDADGHAVPAAIVAVEFDD
jgi:hypothetical protein